VTGVQTCALPICVLERCSSGAKPGVPKARRDDCYCFFEHTPAVTCVLRGGIQMLEFLIQSIRLERELRMTTVSKPHVLSRLEAA